MKQADSEASILSKLQDWYLSECNGDWEHTYGVKIDTLDNPGWSLEVDLWETQLADRGDQERSLTRSDQDWIIVKVSNSKFVAYGGTGNLIEIIKEFLYFSETYRLRV